MLLLVLTTLATLLASSFGQFPRPQTECPAAQFKRWEREVSDYEPKLQLRQDLLDSGSCERECQRSSLCRGFSWETDLTRCSFYLGRDQARRITYQNKDCEGSEPKSAEQLRRSAKIEDAAPFSYTRLIYLGGSCETTCPDIPRVKFGLHNGRNNQIGSQVTYECMFGNLVGNATIECLPKKEWSTPPACVVQRRG